MLFSTKSFFSRLRF